MKTLKYYQENAEENYRTTPISVLRYITELETINDELLEALIHAQKVLTSIADRGYYPLEVMPEEKEYLGKQGFSFMSESIKKATL